jgi:adhesin/invasin
MKRGCRSGHARPFAHRPGSYVLAALAALGASACKHDRGAGPAVAETIALTASATSVGVGQTAIVYVHASDANGTRIPKFGGVTWASSNPTVASVAKADTTATVTGLAVGETVISATVRANLVARIAIRVGAIPVILATPSAAVFTGYRGSNVAPQSISITNAGAGTLTGLAASASSPWLQVSFVDGITTANPTATLRVQPSVGSLADGTYSGTVTVSSGTPGVTPRTIPVTFQVAAGPVAFKIEAVSAPSQGGSAGKPVAQPPAVIVRAADNTPVSGVPVTFAVNGGGAIVPTGVVNTDGNGVAALTSWTLSAQPGASQTVTATSAGLAGSPVVFTATSLAASKIVKVSGDAQSSVLARPLPQPIVVRVTDPNDTPVPNATVTFTAANGGSVAPATATTDANGLASATWTLGAGLGAQTATALLVGPPGSPFVTFTATATGATSITKVSGDDQTGPAGSELPAPLRVRVTGANSQPVLGVTVTFEPGTFGGAASPTTATTDANGEASTRWTLPPSTGPKTLTASISPPTGSVGVTFNATATPPPPSGIIIVDGDGQSGRAASPLPRQVVARVVTTIGSGIAGAAISFTPATGAGQSFSPASGITDSNGEFRTTWTLGTALGSYTATVASPGLPSRTITATANQLPPGVGIFTGGAVKVPNNVVPPAGDQAVLAYSGPASGEVALSGGSFTTPTLPAGTYTLSIVSKSGAFPTTTMYGVSLPGGQITSVGTISVAYPGSGTLRIAVHACSQVGDANGTATVRLYNGINGDLAGGPAYSWTIPFGTLNAETGVAYGIYTMTITTQANDPTKSCAVYRSQVEHSWTTNDGTTSLPLIILSNP